MLNSAQKYRNAFAFRFVILIDVDPTVTAVLADAGTLALRRGTGEAYIKTDAGETINWAPIPTGGGAALTSIADALINSTVQGNVGGNAATAAGSFAGGGTGVGGVSSAQNVDAMAFGQGTLADGEASFAQGLGSQANGDYSHAEGEACVADGQGAHAEGNGTMASANYSHAEGDGSQATQLGAHAEGQNTQATALASHAEGQFTVASGNGSHAEGNQCQAIGAHSHAKGSGAVARQLTQMAHSSWTGESNPGDHQFYRTILNAGQGDTEAFIGDPAGGVRFNVNNTSSALSIRGIATAFDGGDSAMFEFDLLVTNVGAGASIVGQNVTQLHAAGAGVGWTLVIGTNMDDLTFTVTNGPSWTIVVEACEVERVAP